MRFLIILLMVVTYPSSSQQFFTATKDNFFIYDLSTQQVVERFKYGEVGGLLWRPTSNGKAIFYKKNLADAKVTLYYPASNDVEEFTSMHAFTDYQVLSEDELIIRDHQTLYRWHLKKNEYQVVAGRATGSYFYYNNSNQLLVTQNRQNSLELWNSKGERTIIAANIAGFFTANDEIISYATGDLSFEQYRFSTQDKDYQSIKKSGNNKIEALWATGDGSYLLMLNDGLKMSYASYSAGRLLPHPMLGYSQSQSSLLPKIVANSLQHLII